MRIMQIRSNPQLHREARETVNAWIHRREGRTYTNDVVLADYCIRIARAELGIELRTNWIRAECLFESHWQKEGRRVSGLEGQFLAVFEDEARVLACAKFVTCFEDLAALRLLMNVIT
jgi:hypothetical protein